MIWLLAALCLSTAYGQACVCSVQGAYPTNWTGLYKKPDGCAIGDKYTMPHSYPHAQLCNACVADTCACCRGTDNNFMRGINPLDPEVKGPPAPTWDEGTQMVVIIVCSVMFGACALAGAFLLIAGVFRLLIGVTNCVLQACHYCCCRKKAKLDLRDPMPTLEKVVVV